ncbi:transmembrane prolyl 4-hydroxylase-like [Saccoglossus kowalevskii]|uniref:Transmembrane prolyl 4-hydroxylase-like n=1 Tax=Saccoglossus kowalevskii TaxID=10224 RepID=A0ABM0MQT9_SACKO|nr:PREDICTED: transmembrane prolyl 4-hydroxylase-like [Saccoglossus kowalevskii]
MFFSKTFGRFEFSVVFVICAMLPLPWAISVEGASVQNVQKEEDGQTRQCEQESCEQLELQAIENEYLDNLPLKQLDGIKIGHERKLELAPGQFYTVRTLSLRPLLFEIPNFLTDEECEHIIQLAEEKELTNSTTLEDMEEYDEEPEEVDMNMEDLFEGLDENKDGFLDVDEIVNSLEVAHGGFFSENDIKDMYKDLNMDPDGDDLLNVGEFVSVNESLIRDWLDERTERGGANKVRHSKQTWLQQSSTNDSVLNILREKVINLTGLPKNVIENSEQLQVVYYELGGHYHAHYDSEDVIKHENATCGQMAFNFSDNDEMTYRLCRFMTILYYLNDVEEGGETAFPIADNETFTTETLRAAGNKLYDLSNHCKDSNIVVKPEKGKAVMWYNHIIDEETGWMGDMDNFTLHGGCDVHTGRKWIANNWINVADTPQEQAAFDKYIVEVFRNETAQKLEEEKKKKSADEPVSIDAPPLNINDAFPGKDIQIDNKEEL